MLDEYISRLQTSGNLRPANFTLDKWDRSTDECWTLRDRSEGNPRRVHPPYQLVLGDVGFQWMKCSLRRCLPEVGQLCAINDLDSMITMRCNQ